MSGGHFNYVCWKDFRDLICGEGLNDLLTLVDFMEHEYPDAQATKDTRAFYEEVRELWVKYSENPPEQKRLQNVWHAIEWWQSLDCVKSGADKAIEEYETSIADSSQSL